MTEIQTPAGPPVPIPPVPIPPQRSVASVASDGVTFLVYWMVILLLLGQAVTSVLRPPEGEIAAGLASALVCLVWGTFCLVMGVLRVEGPEGAQSPPPGWLVVVTSAGCLISLVFLRTSLGMVGVWSAETTAAGLLVASLTVWRGPLVGGISGVVLAAAMMIAPLSGEPQGEHLLTSPLAESIPAIAVLAAGFCAALALGALGRTAQTLQRSLDERDEALVREQGVRAAAQVAAEVERSLHDTALNTLETIASHGDHLDPAAVVERCRSDVFRLASWRSEAVIHSLSEVLTGLEAHGRRLGLVVEPTLVGGRPADPVTTGTPAAADVPQPVLAAMARAGAEALTNVAKHAHVTHATVLVSQDSDGVQVFVADDGVGSGATSDGFGVSRSIRERMGAVGGQARIGPGANDRGTVVLLEWHPASAAKQQPGSDLLLRMAGVVLMMATFLAGGAAALVVLGWSAYAHPGLALAAAFAPVLIGAVLLGDAREGRRLGAMHVIAACATYVAVSAAALLADPYCSSLLGEGVMIDARAPMMAILLLLAPRPGVLAAIVATVGVAHAMASLAWNDRWLLCGPATASAGVYVISALAASWLFVRRIDRVSAELAGARDEAVAAQIRTSRELAVRAEEELWVADTLAWVQELLQDIAEGRADPTDAQVRAKCAAHAEFLRALLTVGRAPMTLRRPTRIWLRLLHAAGCSIRVRGSFENCDPPAATVGEIGGVIDAVCQFAAGSRVTLAAWSDPDQTFMVTAEGGPAKLPEALIDRVRETPGSAWHEVGEEGLTVEWAWEGAAAVPASVGRSR